MPIGKNDDVIENQTTKNGDMNREYIAGIDVMPKPKNPDSLQGNRVVNNNPKPGDEPVKATFCQKYLTRKYVLGVFRGISNFCGCPIFHIYRNSEESSGRLY